MLGSHTMLRREYGIAASSSLTPVAHPEDAQPNEAINKRAQKLPPAIRNTAPPLIRSSNIHYRGFRGRGGYRGGGMSQRGELTQHAVRGNQSWRGRGMYGSNGGYSNRNVPARSGSWQANEFPLNSTGQEDLSSSSSSSSGGSSNYSPRRARSKELEPEPSCSSSGRAEPTLRTYSSQTSATPPAPERPYRSTTDSWMHRSRSPTPKLPSLPPLKRRKLDHPLEPPRFQEEERRRSISIEASSSLMPPPTSVPRLPLPGRSRRKDSTTMAEPIVPLKEESLSPVRLELAAEPSVKREVLSLSPEPSILSGRKLIKQATKFYDFPEPCKKSDPNYKENRMAFFKEKKKELIGLGLKIEKVVSRDDGLAIDWTSPRPVWSDTLQPKPLDLATAIQLAHEINYDRITSSVSPKRRSASGSSPSQLTSSSTPTRKYTKAEGPPSSQSKNGATRPQTEERTPDGRSGFFIDVQGSSSQMSPPPTPDSHSASRRRLPLPGRQKGPSQATPVALPVAFSPRRSVTPASGSWQHQRRLSGSSSTSTNMNVDEHPVVVPVAFSPRSSAAPAFASKQQNHSSVTLTSNTDELPPPPQVPPPANRLVFKPNPISRRNLLPPTSDPPSQTSVAVSSEASDSKRRETEPEATHFAQATPGEVIVEKETKHVLHREDMLPALPLPTALVEDEQIENENASAPLTVSHGPTLASVPQNSISNETEIPHAPNKVGHARDSDGSEAEDVASALLPSRGDDMDVSDEDDAMTSTSTDGGEMEVYVAEFLQRYCQLFDSDRPKLEMAYAKNALFSCRVHHLEEPSFSMAGLFAPEVKPSFRSSHSRASASTVDQGRTQIGNRLLALGPYQFCPRGVSRNLHYDVVDSGGAAGILVTVHGEVVNPNVAGAHLDHVLTLDQSFVLRQRGAVGGGRKGGVEGDDREDDDDDDDGINGLGQRVEQNWPLVAISHQMTVRAAPLLASEKLEEYLPWIKHIL